VFKTKSGRFRAYLKLNGTKDLKRAKELLAIIYAFFERKSLKPDPSFVGRLNHPVFYEDYHLYRYELVEDVKGEVPFYDLYRKVKKFQRKLSLWTFRGKNLTEKFWGIKAPQRKPRKGCRLIKAPGFRRKLKKELLDNFDLWKRAVSSLAQKHSSRRYTYVIQSAVGWAKYLELPKDEVTEFLVELLGEEKRKDVEKGWRYACDFEFNLPDSFRWAGKVKEEWEGKVIAELQVKGSVSRQELLKKVFFNQKWLCDFIMDGLVEKGIVLCGFSVVSSVTAGEGLKRYLLSPKQLKSLSGK